jgi:hypothetical protein
VLPIAAGIELRIPLSVDQAADRLDDLVEPIPDRRRALTLVGAVQVPRFRVRALLLYHGLGFGCWFRGEIRRLAGETLVSGEVSLTGLEFYLGLLGVCLSGVSLIRGDVAEGVAVLIFPVLAVFDLWLTTHLLRRMLVKQLCSLPSSAKVAV